MSLSPGKFGQCVHKMVQSPQQPGRLYLQHHFGVYRSDDAGDSWKDIGKGLPSDFGFPMVLHPHDCTLALAAEASTPRATKAARGSRSPSACRRSCA